ncbi:MAG: diadenylate cyclase CdaA [Clostridia bacterium]|nr:diadenylate cyclase CdaA [Clostridia bacterium]
MWEMIGSFFEGIWSQVMTFLSSINIFTSLIDILFIAFVIYSVIKLIRDSRAEQLMKGIVLFLLIYAFAALLDLKSVKFMLNILFDNALIVLVVIFQPELRRALERVGQSRLSGALSVIKKNGANDEDIKSVRRAITAVCGAVEQLQRQKMGALIVFERHTKLGEIIDSGTLINADPSPELIGNVFFNKAPLHDGAMIIRDARVHAAGCILPLTTQQQISSSLGTRHRAAVGMSENSDALIVVVSEETGAISLASGGNLTRDYTPKTLQLALENGMFSDLESGDQGKGGFFRKLWKGSDTL